MFRAYREPPRPSFDWKKLGIEKGIPLAGTVGGGIAGALTGDPNAISIGAKLGGNLGGALSGVLSEQPQSQAQMMKGFEGAIGARDEWKQKVKSGGPQINEGGSEPAATPAQPSTPNLGSLFNSSRAGSFFGDNALGGAGMGGGGNLNAAAGKLTPEMLAMLMGGGGY